MLQSHNPQSANPQSLYLVGHEALGWWDGASPGGADEWAYYLPDALGSVRQVTDETGAVTDAREWTPYGEEVGAAQGAPQAGLGYTGEWQDAALGLTYLRARWYDAYLNQFVSPDLIVPDYRNPQSINRYTYSLGNPTNFVDPSGLCAVTGATDCQKFVSEIRCMIEGVRETRECRPLVGALVSEEAMVLDLLAWYYSGIPFTFLGLYLPWVPQETVNQPGDPDRWPVPKWYEQENPNAFEWNHPINQPGSDVGYAMRWANGGYGFKRPYYNNTHHYFAFLKYAYYGPGPAVRYLHKQREIQDQVQPALDIIPAQEQAGESPSDIEQRYAWMYREAVYDLYIVDEAIELAWDVLMTGVDAIPNHIESKWCASTEAEVWSLESQVDQYYFEFPEEYWPDEEYWPGR